MAFAQTATCTSLRNELASLSSAGGASAARYLNAAQRQIDEIQRTAAYARQIGCGNSRFLIFGSDPPAVCAGLNLRLSRMQTNLVNLQAQADRLGGGPSLMVRRNRIEAAIQQYCGTEPRPNEALPDPAPFDQPDQLGTQPDQTGSQDEQTQPEGQERQPLPPGRPVCVRLCDGFFFPLASAGKGGPDAAPEMCQAQCPGAETEAFSMGTGDDITQAIGTGGKSYMELDNALRYQKATVAGCSCRRSNQSWGQALKGAEGMITTHPSDIIVDAEKAEQLSKPAQSGDPRKPGAAKAPAKTPPPPVAASQPQPASPMSGSGQAGTPPASRDPLRETVGPDGQRKVRIIAPSGPTNP